MSYCRTLTRVQLVNVLRDEKSRMERHPPESDVHIGARELHAEAREECLRRGIEPDDMLGETR